MPHTTQTVLTVPVFTNGKSFEKKVTLGELGLSQSQIDSDFLDESIDEALIDYVYDRVECKWKLPCDLKNATRNTSIDFVMTFEGVEALRQSFVLGVFFTQGNPATLTPKEFDSLIEEMWLTNWRNDNLWYEHTLPSVA